MTLQVQKVLAVFLTEPDEDRYGLEVRRTAGLKSGVLYPILARLENAGWLTSGWEDIDAHSDGRRPRRYYHLTTAGAVAGRDALARTAAVITPSLGWRPV